MESVLFGLHVAVRLTVLLAIFFLLSRLYRSRRSAWRHLFWLPASVGMLVLLVALVSLPEMGNAKAGGRGEPEAAAIAANQFFVDANAAKGGDGSAANPFLTIGEALKAASYGDTVLLAPGTYSQPLELISGVTLLGAGAEQTRVVREAHFGLALRPFIQYFERPGEERGLQSVELRDVVMEDFTLDGGDEYPTRPAEEIAELLALAMAIDREDVAAVQALLERNSSLATARILSPDALAKGTTFLHRIVQAYSTSAEDVEIARLLIKHGADVNAEGGQARGSGESALGYAGFFGSAPLVELFLAHGGDPNYVSSTGATPVDATAHEGSHVRDYPRYLACLEAMIQAGGRFDLGHLVQLRHSQRLEAELDANPARVNERIALRHYRDEDGTPLHETADNCDADMAALLVDRGADLNALDNEGRTPLRRAVDRSEDYRSECRQVVELLLKRGAAPDIAAAVIAGDAESVAAILSEDPQAIHQRGPNQWTLLDLAVKYGHDEVEMLLRAAGATLSQNLEALFSEVGPDHSVHKVLAQSSTQLAPGYIHLDHSPSLDIRDEITLAAWVYMLDRGGTIVGKWFQLDSWSYVLHGVGSGFRLRWEDDTQTNLTNFAVPYLQWAHYAATYDGSQMRVFVNGELVAAQDVDGKRIKSTSNPVWIGDSGYLGGSPILLDDVQIWNVARSQKQIRESMHNGLSGDEPGLVGWFPMDSQPLIDRSPHANNGRLEGAATIRAIDIPSDERHAPEQVLWLLPSKLTTAMEMGDVDRVRQLTKEGRWHIIEGDSADLFDGETLKGWWALSDQWTVQDGQIVCPTSERIHFAISEIVIDEPFQLRYEVSALERSHGDGKMVGFVDAAGYNVLVALDDDEPHTIQIDSGRKFFDESGIYGPWQREVAADLQMQIGKWYDVVCTVDGSNFTVSTGDVELSHPFEPEFPVFIWLEVQRTGAKYRGLRISKL